MPLVTLKTMAGTPRDVLDRTLKEVNALVAENLGYDPAHVWVILEEMPHEDFVVAGKTWAELKPMLYPKR